MRSTPGNFRDFDIVRDRDGKLWRYSRPSDVWKLYLNNVAIDASARSWHSLVAHFSPISLAVSEGKEVTVYHDIEEKLLGYSTMVKPDGRYGTFAFYTDRIAEVWYGDLPIGVRVHFRPE